MPKKSENEFQKESETSTSNSSLPSEEETRREIQEWLDQTGKKLLARLERFKMPNRD